MIYRNIRINLFTPNLTTKICGGIFDVKTITDSIADLQIKTNQPNFWDDGQTAQKVLKKISSLENELKMWEELENHCHEVESYIELLDEGEDAADQISGRLDRNQLYIIEADIGERQGDDTYGITSDRPEGDYETNKVYYNPIDGNFYWYDDNKRQFNLVVLGG